MNSGKASAEALQETSPTIAVTKKRRWTADHWLSVLFILPSVVMIGWFVYGFIGWTGFVSLTNWNSLVPDFSFAGLKNYAYLFSDFRFQADLRNTLFLTVVFIAAIVVVGMFLAILLDQNVRQESVFRNIFFFPMALSFVVTGVVWQWLLNPSTGVNLFLKQIGLDSKWYTDTTIIPGIPWGQIEFGIPVAILAVVIAAVWQLTGFAVAMYLAGLRGISDDIREAARVDGATEFQVYRKIVIPLLRPITVSVVIIMAHLSLKIFDLIYAMTGPGANFVTDVPALYMYETTFQGNYYAVGAAISMLLLFFVSLFIIPYLIVSRREEA